MVKPPLHDLQLDNEAVDRLLSKIHGLEPTRDGSESAVHVRLRYLQKLGFPASANAGRGRRAVHGLEGVLQLALAFELLAVGLSPKRAAATVVAEWESSLRALRGGWEAAKVAQIRDDATPRHRGEMADARKEIRFRSVGLDEGPLLAIVLAVTCQTSDGPGERNQFVANDDRIIFETTEIVVDALSLLLDVRHGLTSGLRMRDEDVAAALNEYLRGSSKRPM